MNEDLKQKAAGAGVRLWEIAEAMGIADATLSRWLRRELTEQQRERFLQVIETIKRER